MFRQNCSQRMHRLDWHDSHKWSLCWGQRVSILRTIYWSKLSLLFPPKCATHPCKRSHTQARLLTVCAQSELSCLSWLKAVSCEGPWVLQTQHAGQDNLCNWLPNTQFKPTNATTPDLNFACGRRCTEPWLFQVKLSQDHATCSVSESSCCRSFMISITGWPCYLMHEAEYQGKHAHRCVCISAYQCMLEAAGHKQMLFPVEPMWILGKFSCHMLIKAHHSASITSPWSWGWRHSVPWCLPELHYHIHHWWPCNMQKLHECYAKNAAWFLSLQAATAWHILPRSLPHSAKWCLDSKFLVYTSGVYCRWTHCEPNQSVPELHKQIQAACIQPGKCSQQTLNFAMAWDNVIVIPKPLRWRHCAPKRSSPELHYQIHDLVCSCLKLFLLIQAWPAMGLLQMQNNFNNCLNAYAKWSETLLAHASSGCHCSPSDPNCATNCVHDHCLRQPEAFLGHSSLACHCSPIDTSNQSSMLNIAEPGLSLQLLEALLAHSSLACHCSPANANDKSVMQSCQGLCWQSRCGMSSECTFVKMTQAWFGQARVLPHKPLHVTRSQTKTADRLYLWWMWDDMWHNFQSNNTGGESAIWYGNAKLSKSTSCCQCVARRQQMHYWACKHMTIQRTKGTSSSACPSVSMHFAGSSETDLQYTHVPISSNGQTAFCLTK